MPRTTRRRQRSASPRPPPRDADGALPLTFPCDGFVVQLADPDPVRATHLARRALRDAVGTDAGWSVRPIGPGSRDVDLTPPPSWQPRTAGDAFQVARRLERTKGVEAAEPSFVGPGLAPPPERAAALGFGGEEDADPDPETDGSRYAQADRRAHAHADRRAHADGHSRAGPHLERHRWSLLAYQEEVMDLRRLGGG